MQPAAINESRPLRAAASAPPLRGSRTLEYAPLRCSALPGISSKPEIRNLISVPQIAPWWRKLLAFSGPGYLVAVGYMDPGNWATDLAGGSHFGYALLSVVVASSLIAILLQYLSIKLGVATGFDLAQMCRQRLPRRLNIAMWAMAEVMIVACDLAEVIGTAIALQLLFHLPLTLGLIITGLDVLVLLALQDKGLRYLEALVITLIGTVVACFGFEVFMAHPTLAPLLRGLIPAPTLITNHEMLYLAIGIMGATVMPHNLYLHSSIVKSRGFEQSDEGRREAIKFASIDSSGALLIACAVNAAILILAGAIFFATGHGPVTDLRDAARLLSPALGTAAAGTVFAVALLAAGQNSTVTATLAGQVIMEGFMNLRISPWLRRLLTRSLAIIPAVICVSLFGATGLMQLLIFSQVILSLQLSFAIFPLVSFTNNRKIMGRFANSWPLKISALAIGVLIAGLNGWLVVSVV